MTASGYWVIALMVALSAAFAGGAWLAFRNAKPIKGNTTSKQAYESAYLKFIGILCLCISILPAAVLFLMLYATFVSDLF